MNTLVLQPHSRRLDWSFFIGRSREPAERSSLPLSMSDAGQVTAALARIVADCRRGRRGGPYGSSVRDGVDAAAVRAGFGGAEFDAPAPVTPDTLRALGELAGQDPLHAPGMLTFLDCCQRVLGETPVVLVFETAFFAHLPPREHLYGLDAGLAQGMALRRLGYHGIYHEAACLSAGRRIAGEPPRRILSICLENRPEIAAVLGRRPLMVTGGATPLEGLPGQTSCGELDPGIVLMLAEKLRWGAEQIDQALTRQSGWEGLAGRRADLEELFTSPDPQLQAAMEMVRYRMLLACGAGVAALGGVDRIVFSGRYAGVAEVLGPWLQEKLLRACRHSGGPITWQQFREPLDRLIANAALAGLPTAIPQSVR